MESNSTNNLKERFNLEKAGLVRWLTAPRRIQTILVVGMALLLVGGLTKLAFTNLLISVAVPLALVALPISWLLVVRWRTTFYLIIVTLVFEGLARNLSNQIALLLFKDGLLGLMYLGYLLELRWKFTGVKSFFHFTASYASLAVYCIIEMLNPTMPDISVGVIGLKTVLYYVPLVYIAYEVLDTKEKIIRFSVLVFIFTFITSAFGVYQYLGGPTVIQRFQAAKIVETYGANGVLVSYKLPASFASASNFSGWLYVSFSMAMGLLYSKTSRAITILSLAAAGVSALMFVLNSQRSGLVYVALCLLLGTFSYTTTTWLRIARTGATVLLVGLFVVSLLSEDNAIGSRFSEFTSGDGLQAYLISSPTDQLTEQFDAISKGRLFGLGIGAGAPGARYALPSAYVFVESFIALTLYEMGPLGLLLSLWNLAVILGLAWSSFRRTRGHPLHNLAFFIFVWMIYMMLNSITYAPLTIPPAQLFFWILPGLALRLRDNFVAASPDEHARIIEASPVVLKPGKDAGAGGPRTITGTGVAAFRREYSSKLNSNPRPTGEKSSL